ncbi:hypothetical protein FB567DRAFT_323888 [Paraphoma chrysanthemicola]|uniref:Uncharacterized protein n=1 Tax=Paraphoma chrysanthemicola TaxID=798071 RepID=A0A8K0W034_9PLEO|nr:hypothetical protein FB567DRAFT_323888 [Paraphoma chrysanthemicola]
MLPGLQPSRPKASRFHVLSFDPTDDSQPPQQSAQPTYAHQQRRATHTTSQSVAHTQPTALRPRSQVEAMPPNGALPASPFFDAATRHPVFFTQNLRKPPFPIPQIASQGWSPVASGYIMEQQRALRSEPKTKL